MRRMAATPAITAAELRSRLEADFRARLAVFYRALQLTPPYHTVEKAVLMVRDMLSNLPEPELRATSADPTTLGAFFTQAILDSGLAKKHRGIIAGLLAEQPGRLPLECRPFGEAFKR
jgi:hypothetical protein